MNYKAPIDDMTFVLFDLHAGGELLSWPSLSHVTEDDIKMLMSHAAKFCEEVIAPLNRIGDEQGCVLENGTVRTPDGFRNAYRIFRESGWAALVADPAFGGQGLPLVMQTLFEEMLSAANLSFTSYNGLSLAAYHALHAHGSDAQRARYLPALVEGRWTGTMCLTEPQCGSDLSLLRARATPLENDNYAINGTKIFISAGDHDLTENILHLVLARLPDAPPGIRGISLFLVPKYRIKDNGEIGVANGVQTIALEKKMGLKGSATCQLGFENAIGEMVGAPHQGLKAMFSMMNMARLSVAIQGIGLAEVSYQRAVQYAAERRQGRLAGGADEAVPIINHLDVKRMLMLQQAYVEGMRALAVWIGVALDKSAHHRDEAQRREAGDFVALMTPVAKALCTDLGVECTQLGMQVWGGHGYIRENGMEQYMRDARIGPIYEGTNGIQAADLVGRKICDDGGKRLAAVFDLLDHFLAAYRDAPALAEIIAPFERAYVALRSATRTILTVPAAAHGAVAAPYLRMFGLVTMAYLWARMATLCVAQDTPFRRRKYAAAKFFMNYPLSEHLALAAQVAEGGASLLETEIEAI